MAEGIPGSHKDVYNTWLEPAKIDAAAAQTIAQTIARIEQHPREELYDTQLDPHELKNLAAAPGAYERKLGDEDE